MFITSAHASEGGWREGVVLEGDGGGLSVIEVQPYHKVSSNNVFISSERGQGQPERLWVTALLLGKSAAPESKQHA